VKHFYGDRGVKTSTVHSVARLRSEYTRANFERFRSRKAVPIWLRQQSRATPRRSYGRRSVTYDMIDRERGKTRSGTLKRACRDAKVKNSRFHDQHRGAKTAWAPRGIPAETAMLAAGHSSAQMHQHCVQLQSRTLQKRLGCEKCLQVVNKENFATRLTS
jgi:hypothetical protein